MKLSFPASGSDRLAEHSILSKIENFDMEIKILNAGFLKSNKKIAYVEHDTKRWFQFLEERYEILQSRNNKADIIIEGLPRSLINLNDTVEKHFELGAKCLLLHK